MYIYAFAHSKQANKFILYSQAISSSFFFRSCAKWPHGSCSTIISVSAVLLNHGGIYSVHRQHHTTQHKPVFAHSVSGWTIFIIHLFAVRAGLIMSESYVRLQYCEECAAVRIAYRDFHFPAWSVADIRAKLDYNNNTKSEKLRKNRTPRIIIGRSCRLGGGSGARFLETDHI